MKTVPFSYRQGIQRGLRPTLLNPRNSQYLVECTGLFPEDGVLRVLPDYPLLDTSSITATFPYPQVFILSYVTLAFTESKIYELVGSSWVLRFTVDTEDIGDMWSLCDFGTYIMMTNGVIVATRNPSDSTITKLMDGTVPAANSVCEIGGQVILGSPAPSVSLDWLSGTNTQIINYLHRVIHTELPITYIW